jgi:signal transduction histidine kinase
MSVRDNGIGIKPDVLRILFDKTAPYTTRGTANEKGTGLGLILCKEFVEKNGGKIWVESDDDKGSTFWFTVPKG